ncbi:hypothetical protein L596_027784 [Steinernema carpocapsae]|uniref:G-protein coupled receptors family 1 profile domain-containing protein n=1 Tax=Steinernema carpocapsae TaxID=34508 RepID=A0A4U5LWI4_STECR|nr:hypothetical protein L596_027784 [Steinernema carpocapsae]
MDSSDYASLPYPIIMFVQGVVSLLINGLLILSIISSASHRVRKQYTAVVGVCIAEILLAISFLDISINWVIQLYSNYIPAANRETFQCLVAHYNIFFAVSYQFIGFTSLLIALDRFFVEFYPKLYSKLSITDIGIAIVTCFILALVPLLAALNFSRTARLDYYSNRPYHCMALDSISDTISPFFVLVRIVTISLAILLGLFLFCIHKQKDVKLFKMTAKVKTVSVTSVNDTTTSHHRSKFKNSVVGVAMATSVLFLVIPDVITMIREFEQSDVFLVVYLLNQIRSWLNASVYFLKHPNLRCQLLDLWRRWIH